MLSATFGIPQMPVAPVAPAFVARACYYLKEGRRREERKG
jgi:hypothetical protein